MDGFNGGREGDAVGAAKDGTGGKLGDIGAAVGKSAAAWTSPPSSHRAAIRLPTA